MEKSLGWKPIPLFDKDYAGEMPAMQVKMLSVQCSVHNSGVNLMTITSHISLPGWFLQWNLPALLRPAGQAGAGADPDAGELRRQPGLLETAGRTEETGG